jgi:TATA-binding protein-associated factor Taf7
MSIEEFFTGNATYIVTTVATMASAFGLVQYRTGQLEKRLDKIVDTFELHTKDSDSKYVRLDTFTAVANRLDRMESKIDRLIERDR